MRWPWRGCQQELSQCRMTRPCLQQSESAPVASHERRRQSHQPLRGHELPTMAHTALYNIQHLWSAAIRNRPGTLSNVNRQWSYAYAVLPLPHTHIRLTALCLGLPG